MSAPDTGPLGALVCDDDRRRAATAESAVNGIDYLEVNPADQRELHVHFLKALTGPALTSANVRIEGGVRIPNVTVTDVHPSGDELTVEVDRTGDFSTYVLRIVSGPAADAPPPGYDLALSAVAFSFKVTCPTTFDCRVPDEEPAPDLSTARLDYLARDYDGFLRLALDRLAVTVPDWVDNHPADAQTALLELLAYTADHLSYQQDARATEAYLTTARSRVSARRHARLLDYRPGDGCSARAWITVEVEAGSDADGDVLEAGRQVLSGERGEDPRVDPADLEAALRSDPVVFETLTEIAMREPRNEIAFHTWSGAQCRLPAGSTRATLVNDPDLELAAGEVLVFEEIRSPTTGLEADADPRRRQAVRLTAVTPLVDEVADDHAVVEIEWGAGDALPFDLLLTSRPDPGHPPVQVSVARGNVALADHGVTLTGLPLGIAPGDGRPWRPPVPVPELTRAVPLTGSDAALPAAAAMTPAASAATTVLELDDGEDQWSVLADLLGAGDTKGVVVELERDGVSWLRFGDGVDGARPGAGTAFTIARVRTGTGADGNVGPGTLTRVVTPHTGIDRVSNPLPATGGTDPEDIEAIRRAAPVAFRIQQRAVTEADWVEVAQRRADVQRAAARIRWTGSWYAVMVMIDRIGGLDVTADPLFLADITAYLDRFRVAGYDLTVRDPIWVPLDLAVKVCVGPEHFRADVERRLRQALGAAVNPDGTRGLFHPDNLTFGQPVFVSSVVATAMAVEGVVSATVTRFQQFGKKSAGELTAGVLAPGDLEVARLDDDPSFPEHGRVELDVEGGR